MNEKTDRGIPSEPSLVVLFHTSSHAFRAEEALRDAAIACSLVPVPRHLSSDCGYCLKIARATREEIRRILTGGGVEVAAIHEID